MADKMVQMGKAALLEGKKGGKSGKRGEKKRAAAAAWAKFAFRKEGDKIGVVDIYCDKEDARRRYASVDGRGRGALGLTVFCYLFSVDRLDAMFRRRARRDGAEKARAKMLDLLRPCSPNTVRRALRYFAPSKHKYSASEFPVARFRAAVDGSDSGPDLE